MKNEQELIAKGWKKETLSIHLAEYDECLAQPNKFRRLSYDLGNDFTPEQIGVIRSWVNEVNKRFPNIKLFVSGTGYYMPTVNEQEDNGND